MTQLTDLRIVEIAIKWLIYQYGMTVEQSSQTMSGSLHVGTGHRGEALDVASFVTDIIEVSHDPLAIL